NASKDITHVAIHPIKYWYKLFKKCGFNPTRIYYQVGYPQIQNAPYTLSKKFKIQKFAQLWAIIKLTQLWTIIKLSFRMLCEQEYIFLLTKIKDVCA
ncbi:MAG: hypothetical protein QMD21_06440, partial [Candidatus Thermoplasmatota archaeon]|nr:hypothetical protein [Candidatus Thermoplasmatota archaeon]